ncbi:ThuA domain-containing protein [Flexithrix dorotheae]|uniref:ThuA domain-containing protein n=1 Tax=Flexithrix dorotheae TaxID=70993 RepID=UPI00037E5D8E|nr:ThuA domain-containing protein [Flexithrix dorotheae]
MKSIWIVYLIAILAACNSVDNQKTEQSKLKALILDGQNNHYIWPKSTMMMKSYLEETGLFEVEINRADSIWLGIKYNQSREVPLEGYLEKYPVEPAPKGISKTDPVKISDFSMDFSPYDLIISNLGENSAYWPEATRKKFEQYMNDGGGLVVVHAADNAWGDWDEFNKMIGLGAWGGRDSLTGPYVYMDDEGQIQKDPKEGHCATHGLEHQYVVTTRAPEHPIMKGLPADWLHTQDELYDRMRGPFENATILATAYSDVEKNEQPWEPSFKGTGWNVATLMAINYGKGRVFHSTLGHFDYSMECVGFKTTFQRGAEWAATGKVTQEVPDNFPTKDKAVAVKFE